MIVEYTVSGDARPRRRNRRGEQTRTALIEAAVGQLADEGIRGLTHRLVEQRAGVAQGSAKHHFGSLEGLVGAVLAHMVDVDLPLAIEPEEDEDAATLIRRAQAVMEEVYARPDLARARLELYVYAMGRPELQRTIAEARERFVATFAASLPGPDAELGARFVAAFMDGLVLDQLSAPHGALSDRSGELVIRAGEAARRIASRSSIE